MTDESKPQFCPPKRTSIACAHGICGHGDCMMRVEAQSGHTVIVTLEDLYRER